MMAHVSYPVVCERPAGYSSRWIRDILRDQLGFKGVVFSDDLGMRAAQDAGDYQSRLDASLDAGCDFVLVCGPTDVDDAFTQIQRWPPIINDRREVLCGKFSLSWDEFSVSEKRIEVKSQLDQWIANS